MKVIDNMVIFKSNPENYFNEFHGFKPNTVRRIKSNELDEFMDFKHHLSPNSKIRIEYKPTNINSNTYMFFERTITDITKFEDLWIISWKHE